MKNFKKIVDVRGGGVTKLGHLRTRGGGGQKIGNFCGRPIWMAIGPLGLYLYHISDRSVIIEVSENVTKGGLNLNTLITRGFVCVYSKLIRKFITYNYNILKHFYFEDKLTIFNAS